MTVRRFEGARCVGLHWLFDSTDVSDHRVAKTRCATCPALEACAAELDEVAAESRSDHGGAPMGTWAGRLIGKRKRAESATDPAALARIVEAVGRT